MKTEKLRKGKRPPNSFSSPHSRRPRKSRTDYLCTSTVYHCARVLTRHTRFHGIAICKPFHIRVAVILKRKPECSAESAH